jgi:hypothetical protein
MRYKLFDVLPDGGTVDTGKVLEMASTGDAVRAIFKEFGFTQYIESYRVQASGNNAYITYPYSEGTRNTWFVERIAE